MNGYQLGQCITKIGHIAIFVSKMLTVPHIKSKSKGRRLLKPLLQIQIENSCRSTTPKKEWEKS